MKSSIDGIILLNKPQGITSNALLQQVKKLFKAKKAGHTGSLDPLATGMLPICLGEATKFSQYLLDADKKYLATGLLGIKTNTGDALGEMISKTENFDIASTELLSVLEQFTGKIQQVPSMFSALKHKGTPLYKYAREGVTIERAAREVSIHSLDLLSYDGQSFKIAVSCSKGTYIRNLVEDIGERLGVGAHVTQLHRASTAGFEEESMHSIEDLQKKTPLELNDYLLPTDKAIYYLPSLSLNTEQLVSLRQGKKVMDIGFNGYGDVRLYDEQGQFVGLGGLTESGMLTAKRLLAF